uniref:winged helix-turn-helix domain-containing protein n=1 Tax=Prevotella pectinovora TaxID=1602169 RepID=UPI00307F39FB
VEEKSNPDRIETCLKLEGSINGTTETTTETPTDTTEITTETPVDTTETILKIISKNPKVTAKEIASVCGITEDGVAYHIKKLKQRGRLIRIGGPRNGGEWKVVE